MSSTGATNNKMRRNRVAGGKIHVTPGTRDIPVCVNQ